MHGRYAWLAGLAAADRDRARSRSPRSSRRRAVRLRAAGPRSRDRRRGARHAARHRGRAVARGRRARARHRRAVRPRGRSRRPTSRGSPSAAPIRSLFAHARPWTHDSPVAPDVTTLLYQSLVPPWGETDRRPGDPRVRRRRSIAELAASRRGSPATTSSPPTSPRAGTHSLRAPGRRCRARARGCGRAARCRRIASI